MFSQGVYAQTQGLALGISTDKYTAQYRYYAKRSVEIFNIWKSAFADTDVKVNYILSAFTASPSATSKILSWNNAYQSATYLAIAPYFDCGGLGSSSKAALTALMTESQIISACNTSIATDVKSLVKSIKATADAYGLKMITYESGQSLVEYNVMAYGNGETSGLTNLFISVNRNAKMKDLYLAYISVMRSEGVIGGSSGVPLIHFSSCGTPSKYGSWGSIEYTGQPIETAPKFMALKSLFNESESCTPINDESFYTQMFQSDSAIDNDLYIGYPSITSPKYGDVWVSGKTQLIQWSTFGISVGMYFVDLNIVESNPCHTSALNNTEIVYKIATGIDLALGSYSFMLPLTIVFSGNASYMIEMKGVIYSNYSEYFHIHSQYFLQDVNYICCMGTLKATFSDCLMSHSKPYQNRLRNNSDWSKVMTSGSLCSTSFSTWKVQSCTIDSNGCRQYRTTTGSSYGSFKPVTDCVAKNALYSKLYANEIPWDTNVEGATSLGSFDNCELLYGNYPDIPNSCSTTEGMDDSRCFEISPTFIPTSFPTSHPSKCPTYSPSSRPSRYPTRGPSQPSRRPTRFPTTVPSRAPSKVPTNKPSSSPTLLPSRSPSRSPSSAPSRRPTLIPTVSPSFKPSSRPTKFPTRSPSVNPSRKPSVSPTRLPSLSPTTAPSRLPSNSPTSQPSRVPTKSPNL